MARRKFFRDEENPYDVVNPPAPSIAIPTSSYRDGSKPVEQIETKPKEVSNLTNNLDVASRRMATGQAQSFDGAVLVYRSYTVANLPIPLTVVGFNPPSANS